MSPEFRSLLEAIAYIIGVTIILIMRYRSAEQRKQVHADLTAHKQTVAAQSRAQVETLEQQLSRRYTEDLERVKASLTEEVGKLRFDNEQLSDRLDSVMADLAHERETNRELREAGEFKDNQLALLSKEVDALREAVNAIKKERDITTDALRITTESEQTMKRELAALERKLNELEIKNARLQAELDAYNKTIIPLFERLSLAVEIGKQPDAKAA